MVKYIPIGIISLVTMAKHFPGEWVSDRDEYQAGTTPTIGAEVAYKTTPSYVRVTPPANLNLTDDYPIEYNIYGKYRLSAKEYCISRGEEIHQSSDSEVRISATTYYRRNISFRMFGKWGNPYNKVGSK